MKVINNMEKKLVSVFTFDSTTYAINMEKEAKANNIPGRLIPLPGQIAAGCGLAWMSEISDKDKIIEFTKENNISYSGIYDIYF